MSTAYTIGVRGCQHLGYGATRMSLNEQTRWNQRVTDGHVAHELTMRAMLDAGVDGIVDGGDLTHFSKPLPRDVEAANRVDDLRVERGIWAVGNSGNHCAGGGTDISAMGVMHRPHLGINAVYPDPARGTGDGIGPYPGLYEIHTQETNPHLPEGLALHFVSHYGLSKNLADHGINIDPQPLPEHVNLFFSHGVFMADTRLYHCVDPHGEERPIPEEWAHRGWDAMLLSHYHTMGAVPGYGDGERGTVWYTGSSLRRGFSDEAGPRGWLKVTVQPNGTVQVSPQTIWQRPQHDLPVIDADQLSTTDLDDLITANIETLDLTDGESHRLTGHAGAIVRQRVIHTTPAQRQALTGLHGRYAKLTGGAAWWGIDTAHQRAATTRTVPADGDRAQRAISSRITDFAGEFRARSERLLHAAGVPEPMRPAVSEQAERWAAEACPDADRSEEHSRDTTHEETEKTTTTGGHDDTGTRAVFDVEPDFGPEPPPEDEHDTDPFDTRTLPTEPDWGSPTSDEPPHADEQGEPRTDPAVTNEELPDQDAETPATTRGHDTAPSDEGDDNTPQDSDAEHGEQENVPTGQEQPNDNPSPASNNSAETPTCPDCEDTGTVTCTACKGTGRRGRGNCRACTPKGSGQAPCAACTASEHVDGAA